MRRNRGKIEYDSAVARDTGTGYIFMEVNERWASSPFEWASSLDHISPRHKQDGSLPFVVLAKTVCKLEKSIFRQYVETSCCFHQDIFSSGTFVFRKLFWSENLKDRFRVSQTVEESKGSHFCNMSTSSLSDNSILTKKSFLIDWWHFFYNKLFFESSQCSCTKPSDVIVHKNYRAPLSRRPISAPSSWLCPSFDFLSDNFSHEKSEAS